jgi:hypothetical protein
MGIWLLFPEGLDARRSPRTPLFEFCVMPPISPPEQPNACDFGMKWRFPLARAAAIGLSGFMPGWKPRAETLLPQRGSLQHPRHRRFLSAVNTIRPARTDDLDADNKSSFTFEQFNTRSAQGRLRPVPSIL